MGYGNSRWERCCLRLEGLRACSSSRVRAPGRAGSRSTAARLGSALPTRCWGCGERLQRCAGRAARGARGRRGGLLAFGGDVLAKGLQGSLVGG